MTGKKQPEGQAFGVFKKDDREVIANSVDEAVYYRFNGWQEVAPASPDNQPSTDQ